MRHEGLAPSSVAALLQLAVRSKDDWETALEDVLRLDSDALGVQRTSYWGFRDEPRAIACELGYVAHERLFERGMTLLERDAPAYFAEIGRVQAVVIHDVLDDPRARGLEGYLAGRRIGAMLDVPVLVGGQIVGILCHEHVGSPRRWSEREQEFAVGVCHALMTTLEARARTRAEARARRSAFLASAAAALAADVGREAVARTAVRRALPMLGEGAMLLAYEHGNVRPLAAAGLRPERQQFLEEFMARYSSDLRGPDLGSQAIREQKSLLAPLVPVGPLRERGYDLVDVGLIEAMRVRSAMAVPLSARGRVSGAMVFGSDTRELDAEDLRLAEEYARQVAFMLYNARLFEELQRAVRARDEFLLLASHELRTPLSSLRLNTEVLARQVAASNDPGPARSCEAIVRQVDRLDRLFNRLVDTAEIRTGEIVLQPTEVDLGALVREVGRRFAEPMRRAGSDLVIDGDSPVVGRWDRTRLDQLVENLLENAAKFGHGRPVLVSVTGSDGTARLVVTDQGIGIPRERLRDIFDPFVRAVPLRAFAGLGLGLHVVDAIARAHGGTVSVESREGHGTSFTVELPLEPPASAAPT